MSDTANKTRDERHGKQVSSSAKRGRQTSLAISDTADKSRDERCLRLVSRIICGFCGNSARALNAAFALRSETLIDGIGQPIRCRGFGACAWRE
jgi:hypothetical protein